MNRATWFGLFALGCLGGLAACEAAPERPSVQQPAAQPAGEQQHGSERQAQPAIGKTQVIDNVVNWPAASSRDEDARAALSLRSRQMVDEAPVPMYVVAQSDWLPQAVVTRGKHFAAVSSRHDGLIVSLHATARAHHYKHVKPAVGPDLVRGKPAFITQNEAIWSAAWIDGGVAYSLELECAQLPDSRCDNADLLIQLSDALSYVGGRGGQTQ